MQQVKETQNIEYKRNWRDEHLKWICGFANAQGGKLFIGMDDDGEVVGIDDFERLIEEIPNKTVSHLSLVVDVNHRMKDDRHYVEIVVPESDVPISYNGAYHYRSGSTKQELRGVALQNWLLRKMGKHWEDLPAESAGFQDLDDATIRKFVEMGIACKRLPEDATNDTIRALLDSLHLLTREGHLTNAAVLLFGKDPGKVSPTFGFKIGRFGKRYDDLRFHDIIESNLFTMADEVVKCLCERYLIRPVSYQGLVRVEKLEYPESALREAVLNAIIHRDHASTWAFLRVYDDRLDIWNPGLLPDELNIEKLKGQHSSYPRNPNIARAFFMAGYIESWGKGTNNIVNECIASGLPEPSFDEDQGGFRVVFRKDIYSIEYLNRLGLHERQINAVIWVKDNGPITNAQYQKEYNVTERTGLRDLNDLVQRGILNTGGAKKLRRYFLKP